MEERRGVDAARPALRASVVVATYNRPLELQRLLAGLAVQEVAPVEVIIVDDGSQPPAAPQVPDVPGTEYRLVHQLNGGAGSARHTGILAATSDVVIIIDDDMVVTPRLVAAHLARHELGDEVVQGRYVDVMHEQRPLFDQFIADQQQSYFDRCAVDSAAIAPARLSTGNVSFRRQQYLDVGGFDLTLRRREDSEIGVRLAAAGARFGFADEARSEHDEAPESLETWLRVAYEYGRAEETIAVRHRDTFDPWNLLSEIAAPARWMVTATMRRPASMRVVGRAWARAGALAERLRLPGVAVKGYGMAYALHWFAGLVDGYGGAAPALAELADSRRRRTDAPTTDAPTTTRERTRVDYGGVGVDAVDLPTAVDRIIGLSQEATTSIVVTPNVDHLVLYQRDPAFASVYDRADLVLADGMPLIMIARLLRLPVRTKVSGSDLVEPLMAAAAASGTRVFFLGSDDDTTAAASERLLAAHPELRIVGRSSPWFDRTGDNPGLELAFEEVRESGAQLVMLAFGAPKQEQLLARYRDVVPAACYVCCGASLDFVAEKVRRAPAWISRIGFEWLYRLVQEPGRLWKRYIVRDAGALPIFVRMILRRVTFRSLVR